MLASIQRRTVRLDHVIAQGITQALGRQFVRKQFAGARMGTDFFVHQRLCQRRRVLLVVTEFAETNNVQHHVLAEGHAVLERQLRGQHHRFRVIAVDVQNRGFDHLDNVGTKHRRAHVTRVRGGETDLVIDDDVHRAAGGVTPGLGQRKGFLVNTLAAEGCVAMHQHRQNLFAQRICTSIHARSHRAFNHGVDDLQVRRIKSQRQVNRATACTHIRAETLVVLHVARRQVFRRSVVKLGKQVTRQFAHGVDQHIEPATVGHADDDFLHALRASRLDQLVHGRNETLSAFE